MMGWAGTALKVAVPLAPVDWLRASAVNCVGILN
jgi:hypothetical protein